MSAGTPLPYARAMEIAQGFIADISIGCERIEVAGSLRRRKDMVGDIEIVAIPKMVQAFDLFGSPVQSRSLLDDALENYPIEFGKDRQKKIKLQQIDIDLFITTPDKWGVIYTFRTGSADFSHWLVTWKRNGGALPSYMFVRDGRLQTVKGKIETPEETDFFKAIGLEFIQPVDRTAGRWQR